jgi:quercetin dioxygenase-like cupin family protein
VCSNPEYSFGYGVIIRPSEHTAPYDALVHVIDGEASVRVAGTDYMMRSGQMILLPANKPHALKR